MAFDQPLEGVTITGPSVHGVVTFKAPQGGLELQFSWERIELMQKIWAEEENPQAYLARVSNALDTCDIADLSYVIAFATGMEPDEIKAKNYPLKQLSMAGLIAWSYAWTGGEAPEEDEDKPEKLKPRVTLFGITLRSPFVRVSRGANSGA